MSYFFGFNITNKLTGDIDISGNFTGTVPAKTTESFQHEHPDKTYVINLKLPDGKTVFWPTNSSIAITGGSYVLYVKDNNTFQLKITNSSTSTTNVSIGDDQ